MNQDICRICLQKVDSEEVLDINLDKLNSLISRPILDLNFLPKWEIELFRNHMICITCIEHFRTMKLVYRQACKSSTAIQSEKKRLQLDKVNLRRLRRFSHLEGDLIICRLCLEPTRQIAVYLYDNPINILPRKYIEKMLRFCKIYTNFDKTINPVLCCSCWQHVQSCYSFAKHLKVVTQKIFFYQRLMQKIYLDREDLQEILDTWDQLGIMNGTGVIIKEEYDDFKTPEKQICESAPVKKSEFKKEYALFNDHDYFKIDEEICSIFANRHEKDTSTDCVGMPILEPNVDVASYNEMPKLIPNVEKDSKSLLCDVKQIKDKKLPKSQELLKILKKRPKAKGIVQNKMINIKNDNEEENKIATKYEKAISLIQNKQEKKHANTKYKDKLRNVNKIKKECPPESTQKRKKVSKISKVQKNANQQEGFENMALLKLLQMEDMRPRTRLSAKKEIVDEPSSKDLLVLTKEEIIRKKRPNRKLNASFPNDVLPSKTRKVTEQQNLSLPSIENVPSKSTSNVEYTFERLNFDGVQVKKEVIEEEELQIKREILSDCDAEDNFADNTGCNLIANEEFDDECPNLESFIKSEPLEDSMDLDEEEPPELEFQGPCLPTPISCFTIQNTFTVDEKRMLISSDEKRNLLNLLEEKTNLKNTLVSRSTTNSTESVLKSGVKKNVLSTTSPGLNLKPNSEKPKPKIQVKGNLFKNDIIPKVVEKEDSPKLGQLKNLVVNLKKIDDKINPPPQKVQRSETASSSRNPIAESQPSKSSTSSNCLNPVRMSTYGRKYGSISSKRSQKSFNLHNCPNCSFASHIAECVIEHRQRVHGEKTDSEKLPLRDGLKLTEEQKQIITNYFKQHIEKGTYPNDSEIKMFRQLNPIIQLKDWTKIRLFVYCLLNERDIQLMKSVYNQTDPENYQRWTKRQEDLTKYYFMEYIVQKKLPSESEIIFFREKDLIMKDLDWKDIRYFIYNCINLSEEEEEMNLKLAITEETITLKVPCTKVQKLTILNYFDDMIQKGEYPTKSEILDIRDFDPILHNLDWAIIRNFLYPIIARAVHNNDLKGTKTRLMGWTEEDELLAQKYFKHYIGCRKIPDCSEIETIQKLELALSRKRPRDIQYFIQNIINDYEEKTNLNKSKTGPVSWTEQQKLVIQDYFNRNKNPTETQIKDFIKLIPTLKNIDWMNIKYYIYFFFAQNELERRYRKKRYKPFGWTEDEEVLIQKHFNHFLERGKCPSIAEIEACKKLDNHLDQKSAIEIWTFIDYVLSDFGGSLRFEQEKSWSEAQIFLTKSYFNSHIEKGECPSDEEINTFLQFNPVMSNLNCHSIKSFINNVINEDDNEIILEHEGKLKWWTRWQILTTKKYFKDYIEKAKFPNKEEIEKFKERNSKMKYIPWTRIAFFLLKTISASSWVIQNNANRWLTKRNIQQPVQKKWTKQQKFVIKSSFKHYIEKEEFPSRMEIAEFKKLHPIMRNKSLINIGCFCLNAINAHAFKNAERERLLRWTEEQQLIVKNYFKRRVSQGEIEFFKQSQPLSENKEWQRITSFASYTTDKKDLQNTSTCVESPSTSKEIKQEILDASEPSSIFVITECKV